MYPIKALGIDLARLVFSIHGVDEHSKCKLRKTVKRNNLLAEVAKLPPCIIELVNEAKNIFVPHLFMAQEPLLLIVKTKPIELKSLLNVAGLNGQRLH